MNQIEPLVSVVIPCFNHEYYIEECLYSVLNQDYTNMEIIVTDDYSTDKSREILKKINEIYPEINIIYNSKNLGLITSMNYMLSIAKGEYIAQFSGDDYWCDNYKITKQIDWFLKNPNASICFTGVQKKVKDEIESINYSFEELQNELNIFKKMYILGESYSSFLIKRQFISKKPFPDQIKVFSDWYYVCNVALQGEVGGLKDITVVYRKHEKSLSSLNSKIMLLEHLEICFLLKQCLNDSQINDLNEMINYLIK